MAKTRVKNKTNAIVKNSQKELAAKVNAALVRAGMRYGNGDQFIRDGSSRPAPAMTSMTGRMRARSLDFKKGKKK